MKANNAEHDPTKCMCLHTASTTLLVVNAIATPHHTMQSLHGEVMYCAGVLFAR